MKKKLFYAGTAVALAVVIGISMMSIAKSEKGTGKGAYGRGMGMQGKGMGMQGKGMGGMGMGMGMGCGMAMGQAGMKALMVFNALAENTKLQEKIGLTKEQADKLAAIKTDMAKSEIKSGADLKLLQLDLQDLLKADNPDRSKINSLIDQVAAKETEMKKKMVGGLLDAKAVLTADQVKQLKTMGEEMKKKGFGKGMGQGMGMGQGRGMGWGKGIGQGVEDKEAGEAGK